MNRMFCCSKPKVAPVVPLVNASVTTQPVIPGIEKKNKPYGYIRLFAGKCHVLVLFLLNLIEC